MRRLSALEGVERQTDAAAIGGEMTSAHDMVIGLLGLQETVTGAEVELVSSGKATLRFCIGPAEVQSRVLGSSINWDRVILARKNGKPVGYLSFFMAGYGPFNVRVKSFIDEFGVISGVSRFLVYKLLEQRCKRSPCYVYKMAVPGPMRSKGVGSGLMAFLYSHAKAGALEAIELEVFAKNMTAISFYKGLGFLQIGEIDLRRFGGFLPDSKIIRMKKRWAIHEQGKA